MNEQDFSMLNASLLIIALISLILLLGAGRIFLYSLPFYNIFSDNTSFFFGVAVVVLMIFLSMQNTIKILRNSFQIKNLVRDAKVLAKRLEKVTQIVSQMQEHSASELSSRIEMDLRLADAEIILEHYEVLRKRYSVELFLNVLKLKIYRN